MKKRIIDALLNFNLRFRTGEPQTGSDSTLWMTFEPQPTWTQKVRMWMAALLSVEIEININITI